MKKYSSYFNKRYFPEPEEESDNSTPATEETPEPVSFEEDALFAEDTQSQPDFSDETDELSDVPIDAAIAEDVNNKSDEYAPPAEMPTMPKSDIEATIVSKSAIINGELSVSGDIHMYGKIKGNLTAKGNLEIAGKVIGNVSGNDIELNHCELKGDINALGFVFMDKESVMIGNVSSQDITLDGRVKGDVNASHKVYVRSNAVIVGNVKAAMIAIDEGAALQGQVIIASQGNDALNIADEATPASN